MPEVPPKKRYSKAALPFRARGLPRKITTRAMAEKADEKFFFTGKPCIRNHIDIRYTINGCCRTCNVEASRRGLWKFREWDQVQIPEPKGLEPA